MFQGMGTKPSVFSALFAEMRSEIDEEFFISTKGKRDKYARDFYIQFSLIATAFFIAAASSAIVPSDSQIILGARDSLTITSASGSNSGP